MSEKDIRANTCLNVLEMLQNVVSCDKILEGANNNQKPTDVFVVIGCFDKDQKAFKSIQSYVDQTILKPLSDSEGMSIILTDRDDTFNQLNVLSALSALAYKNGDEACLEEIADRYQDHVGVGHLMNNLGVMFSKRMQYERSVTCYERAKSCFEHEHDHLGNAVATLNIAVLYKLFGHHQKALSSCDTAASLCHDISMITTRDALLPWKVLRRIAGLSQECGNYKRYQDILSIGVLYDITGGNEASIVNLTKCLVTLQLKEQSGEKIEGKELDDFACHLLVLLDQSCTNNLLKTESLNADFMAIVLIVAKMYRDIGHLEEASKLLEKLETAFLLVHGRKSSLYGSLLYEIGSFKLGTGKASEAEIKLKQAEEIFIHYFGGDHHMVASCKSLLGTCAVLKGDTREASTPLNEALTLFKKMNHHHPEVAEILLKFALLYSEEENFHGAKTTLEEALDMFVSACGEVSPKTASAYFQAAAILQKASEFRALAVDKAKKAIDIFVSLGMRSDHPDVMACRCLLGVLHRSLGKSEEAEEQFVKVQQQGSLHDEPCKNAKIIAPEDANMFFQVQTDGGKGGCSHLGAEFLSLVNLVNMKMGDDQRSHLNALLGCLQEHDTEVLTVLDYAGHNVYCVSHRVWIAGRAVYCVLTSDPMLDPFQHNQGINFGHVHASSKSGNSKKPDVFFLSSSDHGKKPPFLLFWKTPRVLEMKDLSCVGPAFRESVNMLFVQPKFRKSYIEGQDFYMELTLPEDPCAMSSLCTQIDYLPLLAELELSESPEECGNIDSHVTAVTSSPHISCFSYKFPNQHQAEFVFHHVIFSLGKTVTEMQDVERSNASAVHNFEFFLFLEPHNSISVVVEKESVVVKCHTGLESNCICSSVRNTLENTMESLCHVFKMNFEPFLQLPCEDVGGNYMKQSSKCSCCCKDFQCESSCSGLASETAHLCAHASSREPESDHLEGNRSADMLQNENEEDVPFTGHPADKSSIEVCVSLLECLLSNRHVSSEVSSSGIGEISSTDSACCDDNTQHNNSFLSLRSTSNSSLNSYPTSPSSACEMPVFLRNMSPSLGKEAIEPSGGENDSNTEHLPENASTVSVHDCSESPLTLQEKRSQSSFGDNMLEDHSSMRSSYEEGLSSGEGTETRETVWLEDTPEGENSVQSVHTGCNTPSEAGHRIGSQGTPLPSFTTALQGNGEESIANDSLISQFQSESDVVFYQHQCHELRLQITQLEEKLQQSEEEKQELQFDVGRQSFLECKEKRSVKVLQSSMVHVSEQSKSCAANGTSDVMTDMEEKLPGGAGPLREPCSSLQRKLLEISNSLSEAELTRMKLLARPKVNGFRLAKMRRGLELFKELESTGESHAYVRELLKGIRRYDLLVTLDTPLLDNTESGSCLPTGRRMQDRMNEFPDEDHMPSGDHNLDVLLERHDDAGDGNSDGIHVHGNEGNGMASGVDQMDSGRNMSIGNSEDSGGDMDGLSVNPNCDGSSAQTEPKAEEHTGVADSSNGGFMPNESCSSAVGSSELSASSALIAQPLRVDSNSSSSTSHDASDGSLRTTLHHHSAVDPSSDKEESLESSLLLSESDRECKSGEIEAAEACATRVSHTGSGPVSSPDRVRKSSKLKHTPGLQQDVLVDGDMPVGQNGSGACVGVGKDSTVDQSVHDLSTQSNEWQRLGARPRDRAPMKRFPVEPSLVDLVPQEVAGPVAHGLAGAFLARHSQDESFYQGSAEQVLPDDSSSQGASYMDDPNKAKPYFGDCQVASRPDAHSGSLLPLLSLTGGGYDRRNAEGGYVYNEQFNANNGLVPGTSSSYFGGNNFLVNGDFPSSNVFSTSNCDSFRTDTSRSTGMPYIPLDGQIESGVHTSVPRNQHPHSGMTGSHLANGSLMGGAEPQLTPPIYGAQRYSGLNGNTLAIASEHEKTQTTWTTNPGLSTSTRNMARVDVGSSGLPSPYSVPRSDGADSGLVRLAESTRTSQYGPFSANNNTLNTAGDRVVAAAANREGNLDPPHIDAAFPSGNSRVSRLVAGANTEPRGAEAALPSANTRGSMLNRDFGTSSVESTDNSLLALEQRVEEACAMVERVLREREERELFGREIEKKEREIRELRARKRREREARELEEASRWPQEQEAITGRSQWLCEHYQRHCRVRFPCCSHFYSCHRCHNNSKACDNEEAKASHATHLKCSFCQQEQEIGEDSGKCRSCGGNMSAYFCSICKHFTSVDKNPYHCEKCGICRIHEDKSFHCDVCNVCLDKRLEGKHKCRPDSGHDECCICLEDAFSGCQILPCSHKVHRECAIAMIQNGIRTCPVCRHPLYSSAASE